MVFADKLVTKPTWSQAMQAFSSDIKNFSAAVFSQSFQAYAAKTLNLFPGLENLLSMPVHTKLEGIMLSTFNAAFQLLLLLEALGLPPQKWTACSQSI